MTALSTMPPSLPLISGSLLYVGGDVNCFEAIQMIINKALEILILKAFRNAFDIVEKKKFCCQEPIYEGKLFEHCFGESLKGIITVTISRDRFEP